MLVNSNYRYGGGGIGSSLIIEGYYNDSKFYQDNSFTTEIDGESGKLYVDLSTNKTYRWTGSIFTAFNADLLDGKHASDFASLISNGNMSGIDATSITGAGVLLKDESTGTVWNVHTHGDQLRIFNGSSEYIMIDDRNIGSQSVANAATAHQVISPSSKVKLYENNEGGNLELMGPDGVHLMQMDLYNNESFRMYFYDGEKLSFPLSFDFSSQKLNINGNAETASNADTVDGLHAWHMATLNADGGSHGTSFPMFCKHNVLGDNRFYIGVSGGGYERSVAVGFAEAAASASNANTATTADRLSTSAGSVTQPVYFSDGKPVACTYTLGKSVPSNAVFTDTIPTNVDTVDGLHAWNMATLDANGGSHGTNFPMYCRHNVLGDGRFYIGVSGGYERSVAVAFAEKASIAYSTSTATTATTAATSCTLESLIIGTSNANYATILDWANAKHGLACASIITGNGIPSDAPTQDEAMLRLESDGYGARKIVTWTKYGGGTPVIYQRAIFTGNWLDAGWERVK